MSAKKRHHQNTLILGLVASLGGLAVPAQAQDAATKTLIEQGQYWQSRGDAQRAVDSWQKLLRVDPNQPDALYGMARAQLQGQNVEEAQRYLEQLRRAHPNHRLVIEGFRKNNNAVAAFIFSKPNDSYAANTPNGDVNNTGIIGTVVYELYDPNARKRPVSRDNDDLDAFPADNGYAPAPR